jgi:protein TonB
MKIISLFILSLLVLNSQAQDTKKVTKKHKAPTYIEEYYVLKSDKSIRHGEYKKIDYSGKVVALGFYKNNEKDSVWTYSFWTTNIVSSEGNYKQGKKTGIWFEYYRISESKKVKTKGLYEAGSMVGIWEYNNPSSELIQKYDYTNDTIIEFMPNNEEFEIHSDSGIVLTKLERPPLYIGGELSIFKKINGQINYPTDAIENDISGTVLVSFYVDLDGTAFDYKIEKAIGGGCGEEALRVVKLIPNNWIPGLLV